MSSVHWTTRIDGDIPLKISTDATFLPQTIPKIFSESVSKWSEKKALVCPFRKGIIVLCLNKSTEVKIKKK